MQRHRHVADLVEEQRAAIGLAHQAGRAALARAGEGAIAVAKQFSLNQALGQRRAIDRDKGAAAPAGRMGVARQLLFASAGLAADEDWHVALRRRFGVANDARDGGIDGNKRRGRALALRWRRFGDGAQHRRDMRVFDHGAETAADFVLQALALLLAPFRHEDAEAGAEYIAEVATGRYRQPMQ